MVSVIACPPLLSGPLMKTVQVDLPRKLRAILAADVEGYSRMIGQDDAATVKLLFGRKNILETEVARFRGKVFSEAGDGFFAEFESTADAVLCAVDIQKSVARANARRRSKSMWFRIGISLGDIIDDGSTKHGNAINIAARIQSIADPGGICITTPVFEQVANKVPFAFDDLGPAHLKNISRPVSLVRVRWAEKARAARHRTAAPEHKFAEKPSIAVLPFGFRGSPRSKSYLIDGLVEEIITELSKYRWLSVVSKGSSFAYKARKVDMRLIAHELGVRYLIEGGLQRGGNRLRIIVHLVAGETGEELWSDRFDRSTQEVFELQDDVVMGIAGAIEPKVRSAEIRRSRKKPTNSLTAYDYYLQALSHRAAINRQSNQIALRLLKKAIALDSHFAPALALAAMCYATRKDQGWGELDVRTLKKTLAMAQTAIELDFDNPSVLYLAGHTIASISADIVTAVSLIERSLKINPSCSEAWARSAMVRIYSGDLVTAKLHADNAIRLSPLDERLFLPFCALGYCYLFSGRYHEAIEAARRALLGPQRPPMAYIILLSAFHSLGNGGGAAKAASSLLERAPTFRINKWLAQSCFVVHDQLKVIEDAFRAASLPE
jgi:TolB-like protein/class 3 adenylate cyclase